MDGLTLILALVFLHGLISTHALVFLRATIATPSIVHSAREKPAETETRTNITVCPKGPAATLTPGGQQTYTLAEPLLPADDWQA